jgi:capsule polysaccharide export protein KpsE/RkpR
MEMDAFLISGNGRKLDGEVAFLRKKIDELSKEIQQLNTNVSFISNAKEENPLVQKIKTSIESQTKDLQLWKKKLAYLRSLEL